MGTEIFTVAQRRNDAHEWIEVHGGFLAGRDPFDWPSTCMFAFLAGVRNFSGIAPITDPRGLPDDFRVGEFGDGDDSWRWSEYHSTSWLSVTELLAVDYDQVIEDRRVTREASSRSWDSGQTCPPGEGEILTLREFLGDAFFHDLAKVKELGVERIVFGFS